MSVINAIPMLLGGEGYEISRSVRLRSSASAYFNRTLASSGSLRAWTWSAWVKRGALSSNQSLFGWVDITSGNFQHAIYFVSDNTLEFQMYNSALGGYVNRKNTAQVFRDTSAWYHLVVVWDSNNATAEDRARIYVNGSRVTAWANNTNPALNQDSYINNSSYPLGLGRSVPSSTFYFDGYLTEVNFIDGQALTPSSFGETDSITGVWKPKKYAGTYGTNGFYLNFSDNSSNTATTIGKDNSGNGNNWTPNNISVTSGVTYDSMIDSPTMYADGGNGRGNYPVLNPLYNTGTLGYLPTRNANLTVYDSSGDANWRSRWATMQLPTTGKWYAEFPITYSGAASVSSAGAIAIGLHDGGSASYVGKTSTTYGYFANATRHNNSSPVSYGATYANGDIIGVAYDADAGTLTFYKNGTSQGVAYSSIPVGTYFFGVSAFWVSPDGNTVINANFGQRPFAYTPPTGFKALNTQNLPDATIKKGGSYFNATLWTGDNASTRTISGVGFQPDLVWVKSRSNAQDNLLLDSVRAGTYNLVSNATSAEFAASAFSGGAIDSIASDGFSLLRGSSNGNNVNQSTYTYVGWTWKESASAGFDIVTYTGTGVARTVAHSLGVAPAMMIIKSRSSAVDWLVYHVSLGNPNYILLNTTAAAATNAAAWNNTSPTSSVFTVGTGTSVNANAATYVAYLFAEVAGYSKFGSYTGNGSADGPFVYLGFRPRWLMVKNTGGAAQWYIYDSARDTYNIATNGLFASSSQAETSIAWVDFTSNGFKVRGTSTDYNGSGTSYIYAAFAENPFKNSLAR